MNWVYFWAFIDMKDDFIQKIAHLLEGKVIESELIQSLWSGYGGLYRFKLLHPYFTSIIVKHISYSNIAAHPRGWKTNAGHQRKIRSYQVETAFYQQYIGRLNESLIVPQLIKRFESDGDTFLILTDLEQNKLQPQTQVTQEGIYSVLKWLAQFHASFIQNRAEDLWEIGTYWHLATRADEFNKMPNNALKQKAHLIDKKLNNSQFKTIIHGDAKWANFCFSSDQQRVGGLDFQYTGVGCGIKDVMYFLSSVLDSKGLFQYADKLVDHYFEFFHAASQEIISKNLSVEIENEWRALYPFAWADFTRFLQGWMPTHHKLTGYALEQTQKALFQL